MLRRLFVLICLLTAIVGCSRNERPLKPIRPTPTPSGVVVRGEPTTVSFAQLNQNPAAFLGQKIRVSGAFMVVPSQECLLFRGPQMRWSLVADNLQMNANGFDRVLSIVPEGVQLTVEGVWQLYEGPFGCGKEPPDSTVWYVHVTRIVQPNPLTASGGTVALPGGSGEAGGEGPLDNGQGGGDGSEDATPAPGDDSDGGQLPPETTPGAADAATATAFAATVALTLTPPTPTPSPTRTPSPTPGGGGATETPTPTQTPTLTPATGATSTPTDVPGSATPTPTGTVPGGGLPTQPPTPPGTPLPGVTATNPYPGFTPTATATSAYP